MVELRGNPSRTTIQRLKTLTSEHWSAQGEDYVCKPASANRYQATRDMLDEAKLAFSGHSAASHELRIPRTEMDAILALDIGKVHQR